MGFLSKLMGKKPSVTCKTARGTEKADIALREGRAGRMDFPDMLRIVCGAQVIVPLAGPPNIQGDSLQSWKPATCTKQQTGGQFLLAYTSDTFLDEFYGQNPGHSYGFAIDVQWLLSVLPPDHGITFNLGSDYALEWDSESISRFCSRSGHMATE